jgi:hypothetical protein
MGTNKVNNKKSHNRIRSGKKMACKSLSGSSLQKFSEPSLSRDSRESLISHFSVSTYNSQNAVSALSDPVTNCHTLAGIPTHNNSTIAPENPEGNSHESRPILSSRNPQMTPRSQSPFPLFSNPISGTIQSIKWRLMQSKGRMKNLGLYCVVAWVGVLSASSANVVICVQPRGVARMQLADHECCSACSDSTCAACSRPLNSPACLAHSVDCCQDVVFPFPPATVVSPVFSSGSAPSAMVGDLAEYSQYNSKIPYSVNGLTMCDPAVETAILRI